MKIGEDVLIDTIERDCSFCNNKVHTIEIRKRQSQLTIKGELVDFQEIYYLCQLTDPADELGNTFCPAGIMDENLNRARNAYRRKHGLPESTSKHI
ncbi:MAG: hypothetical protein U9N81_09950 [Bacillota bacterium]|nr:hypothetical protein [Bacillota bacterium]